MVLRNRPNALAIVLPTLREKRKYQGHDKLPITVWMMAQVRVVFNSPYVNLDQVYRNLSESFRTVKMWTGLPR